MGHRIAIMTDGALQQVGPPQEVYDRPANLFVAGFIGTPADEHGPGPGRRRRADGARGRACPARDVALPGAERRSRRWRRRDGRASACGPSTCASAATGIVPATVTGRRVARPRAARRRAGSTTASSIIARQAPTRRRRPTATPCAVGRRRARCTVFDAGARGDRCRRVRRRADRTGAEPAMPAAVRRRCASAAAGARSVLGYRAHRCRRCVIFGDVRLLPVHQELLARRSTAVAAVPGAAAHLGRASTSTTTSSRPTQFRNSLKVTMKFVLLTVPLGIVARSAARGARPPEAARHRHLPHDLLVDGRDIGRGRVGDLLHAAEPADRLGQLLARSARAANLLQDPKWALLGGRHVTVWQNLGLSFILMSAGAAERSPTTCSKRHASTARARGRAFRNVTLPMLSPTFFFAVGRRHDLRVPGVRPDRHPDRGRPRRTRRTCSSYSIYTTVFQRSTTTGRPRCWRSRCSRSRWCSR